MARLSHATHLSSADLCTDFDVALGALASPLRVFAPAWGLCPAGFFGTVVRWTIQA
jgi:hypothetical protein